LSSYARFNRSAKSRELDHFCEGAAGQTRASIQIMNRFMRCKFQLEFSEDLMSALIPNVKVSPCRALSGTLFLDSIGFEIHDWGFGSLATETSTFLMITITGNIHIFRFLHPTPQPIRLSPPKAVRQLHISNSQHYALWLPAAILGADGRGGRQSLHESRFSLRLSAKPRPQHGQCGM